MKPFNSDGKLNVVVTGGLRRAAVRGAAASIAGQAGSFAVSTGSVVVLARLLTPSDFGIMTMVTTFSLLLRSFGVNGFTELIMQREEITDYFASNLFWINLIISALIAAGFASSGPLLALFYHNEAVVGVAKAMSLTIVIGSVGYIHSALLQRTMHFRGTAFISFAGQSILVVVSIILALAGFHYWALVWGSVAQTIVTSLGSWMVCRWIPRLPSRTPGTRSGFAFAINVYSRYAFNYLTGNTDNLLVGWRYGARELGFYKKAYDLFVLPESQLMSPLTSVAVTMLSRLRGDRSAFERYFLRLISVLAFVGMGIGTDFALVGKDLIRLVLGPGWDKAGQIFCLFGPGIGVMLLYYTHGWIHLSIGRPGRWLYWSVIEFLCTASLFLLTLRWGPSGIAFAWTASYFLLMFPGFWYAGKPIGLGLRPIVAVIWKFFGASSAAGCATFLIIRTVPFVVVAGSAPVALARMTISSLIFCILYMISLIALHNGCEPISETLDLFRELLPARNRSREIHEAVDMIAPK